MTPSEKNQIRELALQYAEIASLPINQERQARCRRINDLTPDRPPVWIDEIPWHEMDIDGQLRLTSEDPLAREMEWFFREKLYRWKYIQADMVLTSHYPMRKQYEFTGIGIDIQERRLAVDGGNPIVSHAYQDMLASPEDLEKLHPPKLILDPALNAERFHQAQQVLEGIMPVRWTGTYISTSPWDQISMLRGVQPILLDTVLRPEHLCATIERFVAIEQAKMDQLEAAGLLDPEPITLHCTPSYTSSLPAGDYQGGPYRLKDVWIRGTAQTFSSISPAMHEAFELHYMKPLFAQCGLVYYGCCEPLDDRIDLLKQIPNMRKIGVSPWANVWKCAEQIQGDYVVARKPNPALVAVSLNTDALKKEIRDTLEACRQHHCACEFVLKDISTVGYKPQTLMEWSRVVQQTIDEFY